MKRREAKAAGFTIYITGKPCVRGHAAPRRTKTGKCTACEVDRVKSVAYRDARKLSYRENIVAERERSRIAARKRRAADLDAARAREREKARAAYRRRVSSPEGRQAHNADKSSRKGRRRREIVADLSRAQRGRCAYCRDPLGASAIHIDHIQPRVRGGSNARRNLQLACDACNFAKGGKDPIAFAQELGRLV